MSCSHRTAVASVFAAEAAAAGDTSLLAAFASLIHILFSSSSSPWARMEAQEHLSSMVATPRTRVHRLVHTLQSQCSHPEACVRAAPCSHAHGSRESSTGLDSEATVARTPRPRPRRERRQPPCHAPRRPSPPHGLSSSPPPGARSWGQMRPRPRTDPSVSDMSYVSYEARRNWLSSYYWVLQAGGLSNR